MFRKAHSMYGRLLVQEVDNHYADFGLLSGKPGGALVSIEPIRVEVEGEDDGRVLASVSELPGVMAYGDVEEEASWLK